MCKRLSCLFFAFFLSSSFLLPAQPPATYSQTETIKTQLQNMKIDLQLLKISIENYKTKLSELQNLITQSATISQEQAELLADSLINLKAMETQYSELLMDYQSLNRRYQLSLNGNKILLMALGISVGYNIYQALKD